MATLNDNLIELLEADNSDEADAILECIEDEDCDEEEVVDMLRDFLIVHPDFSAENQVDRYIRDNVILKDAEADSFIRPKESLLPEDDEDDGYFVPEEDEDDDD